MSHRDHILRSPDEDGAPAERRAGSVQLRETTPGGAALLVDPANQSIADALRISFLLLKFGMLALGVLYILSGFQFVKEGEQGIRLLFGKVEDANVEPGFRYSWPFPLGEMVRVETGANDLKVDNVFWVELSGSQTSATPVDQLTPQQSLKLKDNSGSVLTADGNIAHVRVSAVYRLTNPGNYAANIYPGGDKEREEEKRLVRLAIQRGVVHAVASVSIDELLKQTSGGETAVASIALRGAQDMLDGLKSGISIDTLTLEPIAPLFVRADFAKVQAAVSDAARLTEEARLDAQRDLNAAAGAAAPAIIDAINAYEAAITRANKDEQDAALARIDTILREGKAMVDGREVLLTGDASQLMNLARQYRTEIIARRRGKLDAFDAKLAQFNSNAAVMIQREWGSAIREFYSRENVETFMMYPGIGTLAIKLNRDQDIEKEQVKFIKKQQLDKATIERNKEWQSTQFKTNLESTRER